MRAVWIRMISRPWPPHLYLLLKSLIYIWIFEAIMSIASPQALALAILRDRSFRAEAMRYLMEYDDTIA